MDYETFRGFASKIFPMTFLVQLARDPLAFMELIQSPQFSRFMAAAYKADALSENSRDTIYSIGGELNGALDQIRSLDLGDLIEYSQLLLQTPSTLSGSNFVNQSLTKQVSELETANSSLAQAKKSLEVEVATLTSERRKYDDNMVQVNYEHRKKIFLLNEKMSTINHELRRRRMQFFFRSWGLIHGSTSSVPNVNGQVRLIGITPSAEVLSTEELLNQISGTALLLRSDGTVCELPFLFSMDSKLAEIREKVRNEQAKRGQSSKEFERPIPPEGIVRLRYQNTIQRMIYDLYPQKEEQLDLNGMLIGFVQEKELAIASNYPRTPLEQQGGLQKLPFSLCTSWEIASGNMDRFGIVMTTLEGLQRLKVAISVRGGCFPKLFRPKRQEKETQTTLP